MNISLEITSARHRFVHTRTEEARAEDNNNTDKTQKTIK